MRGIGPPIYEWHRAPQEPDPALQLVTEAQILPVCFLVPVNKNLRTFPKSVLGEISDKLKNFLSYT